MKLTSRINIIATLATALIAGCAADKSEVKDFFPPDDSSRKVNQFVDVQASNGAREDATLQPYHFDAEQLNSLGQQKLQRMIPDRPDGNVSVYLNLPAGAELTAARHEQVASYLKSLGIDEDHVKIHDGPNTDLSWPAAEGMSRLAKTESGNADGSAPAPSGSASASGGSTMNSSSSWK